MLLILLMMRMILLMLLGMIMLLLMITSPFQSGFAMLEAGSVRTKNVSNILSKNFADMCLGVIFFGTLGYGLAFGEGNKWVGLEHFGGSGLTGALLPHAFMQATFAATCSTIVSGAVAERSDYVGYLVFSALVTGVFYPIQVHWTWHPQGWLAEQGFTDFAGSGVVHLAGAMLALPGAVIIGPRTDRWLTGGIVGHSIPLCCLGFFILNFGFMAFNGGSTGSITSQGDGHTLARAVVNTLLGSSSGGVTVLFAYKMMTNRWSLLRSINGSLAGMVGVCAGCNLYLPHAAFIVAAISAFTHLLISGAMLVLRIDDPLDAVAVHGGGGIVGILALPVFMPGGLWQGHSQAAAAMLTANATGAGAIAAYNLLVGIAVFGSLRLVGRLRKDLETEKIGSDWVKHGEESYPQEAWLQLEDPRKLLWRQNSFHSTISAIRSQMK
jgi:Amt family ammonium transporter